jgi:hypothetical protein
MRNDEETSKTPECRPAVPPGWKVTRTMSFADADGDDFAVIEFIGREECEHDRD